MKNYLIAILLSSAAFTLTSCASIVSGTKQEIQVHNGELKNASCSIQNDKGRWFVERTPSTVLVHRSYNKLQITCFKPGYRTNTKLVPSTTRGLAFGNIVAGGVIGAGVDMANGAAYDYPSDIFIPLNKKKIA